MSFAISKQKPLYKWISTGYITLEQLRVLCTYFGTASERRRSVAYFFPFTLALRTVRNGTLRHVAVRCVALRCVTGCWKLGLTWSVKTEYIDIADISYFKMWYGPITNILSCKFLCCLHFFCVIKLKIFVDAVWIRMLLFVMCVRLIFSLAPTSLSVLLHSFILAWKLNCSTNHYHHGLFVGPSTFIVKSYLLPF